MRNSLSSVKMKTTAKRLKKKISNTGKYIGKRNGNFN